MSDRTAKRLACAITSLWIRSNIDNGALDSWALPEADLVKLERAADELISELERRSRGEPLPGKRSFKEYD